MNLDERLNAIVSKHTKLALIGGRQEMPVFDAFAIAKEAYALDRPAPSTEPEREYQRYDPNEDAVG